MLRMNLLAATLVIATHQTTPAQHDDTAPASLRVTTTLTPPRPTEFVLEPGTHSLQDLIERSAVFLGRNHVFNEAQCNGPEMQVRLQNRLALDKDGCERVVSQLAYSLGFVFVPLEPSFGIYEVIAVSSHKRYEIHSRARTMTSSEVLANRHKKIYVQCTVEIIHIDVKRLTTSLRPMLVNNGDSISSVTIGQAGTSNSMVLMGFADAVASTIEMIHRADVKAGGGDPDAPEEGAAPPPTLKTTLDTILKKLTSLERRLLELEKASK